MGVFLRFCSALLCAALALYSQSVYGIYPYAGTDFGGEGQPAVHAPLIQPQGVAVERDGSIVFADAGDHRVRRILPNGFVSSLAGDGIAGTETRLRTPYGVAVGPNREIYIADLGNARVLRLNTDGSRREFDGFRQPRNVAVDANGVLYVSDFETNLVYRVQTDGARESVTSEKLSGPAGLAFDPSGSLYIADSGNQRVIAVKNGVVRTILKNFGPVTSIAIDLGGRLYAAGGDRVAVVSPAGDITTLATAADEVALDVYGSLITAARRQIRSYRLGSVTTLAGNSMVAYTGDGRPRDEWRFIQPHSVVRDGLGNLYIADSGTGRIRRVDAAGTLSTLVSSLSSPAYLAVDSLDRLYFSDSKAGVIYRIELDGTSKVFSRGSGTKPFLQPSALAFDGFGQLYVADTGNGMIRKVAQDGFVSTIAGGGTSSKDGFGTSIEVKAPVGVAVAKDGAVWFTESGRLRMLRPDGRVITAPDLPLVDPRGLHFDQESRLVIADAGANKVFRVATDGTWETLAGSGESGFSGDDGPALKATFIGPTDAWPDTDGSILISDKGNNRIRKLKALEAGPVVTSKLRVLHGGTGKEEAVAPGQIAFLESDEPFPFSTMRVWFGDTAAEVVSSTPARITVIVPDVLSPGLAQVRVEEWAVAPVEIAGQAPALSGAIENSDGSTNSVDNPASRTGTVKLRLMGVGAGSNPAILAEIASIEIPVVSVERTAGELTVVLQLPGGFLPSGSSPLSLSVNSVKVAGPLNVVIR